MDSPAPRTRTRVHRGGSVAAERPTLCVARRGGLARQERRRRRTLGERAADQSAATYRAHLHATTQAHRRAWAHPPGRRRALPREQHALTGIAPREQRYRQRDRRRQTEQSVQHEQRTLLSINGEWLGLWPQCSPRLPVVPDRLQCAIDSRRGYRRGWLPASLCAALLCLAGCGSGAGPAHSASVPAYVTEPPTHEQQLVTAGARLVVADGCSACHLLASASRLAPGFTSLAGHRVTLSDGRRVLVDEAFVREALRQPGAHVMKGYDAAPMIAAVRRAKLAEHPHQIEELAAFIEQIGPEQGE